MYGFLISMTAFFLGVNNIGAVLYAEVPALDTGGGFISLSPAVDVGFSLFVMLIAALCAALFWKRFRATGLRLAPSPRSFPIAYLLALAGLSLVVDGLGLLGLLYPYSGLLLPMGVYALLLIGLYALAGFLLGRTLYHSIPATLAGAGGITAGLLGLGGWALSTVRPMMENNVAIGYTHQVMNSPAGPLLGRLNLPASVLLGVYEYAYYDGIHALSIPVLTLLTCLLPPVVFTLGWLGAGGRRHLQQRNEATR